MSSLQLMKVALVGHALFLGSLVCYGAYRLEQWHAASIPPIPRRTPETIPLRNSRPELIDDDRLQTVLNRLLPRLDRARPSINAVDHALRMWGLEAEFDDEQVWSGADLRDLLLDHRLFAQAWGKETRPFLVADVRQQKLGFRTRRGSATASHVDHTLAGLAEVGTSLDHPVLTAAGELPLQAAYDQAFDRFSLNQEEYEWSTFVWLHYLPHVTTWTTREGQLVTWDRLADRLMRQRLRQGVCFGQHRLYVLATLLIQDEKYHLLTPEGRHTVEAYLADVTVRLVATQHADGYWQGNWPGEETEGPSSEAGGHLGVQADRLLATGHILEWWAYAPTSALPPDEVIERASAWLMQEIEGLSETQVRRYYPFLTHAGRALALWNGQTPYAAWQAGRARADDLDGPVRAPSREDRAPVPEPDLPR